jgi:hypothetical protein
MCLSKILKMPEHKPKFGYKVFLQDRRGKLHPSCQCNSDIKLEEETWIDDDNKERISFGYRKDYNSGFHVFRYIEDAQKYQQKFDGDDPTMHEVVRKVSMRKIETYGLQQIITYDLGQPECFVCREIFIFRPEKIKKDKKKSLRTASKSC